MTTLIRQSRPVAFTPGIHLEDAFAAYWVRQVTLRLRREICWLWQERNLTPPSDHALPPFTDRTQWILDLARHADVKRHFFETNETAQYLSKEIARTPPPNELSQRGSFSWIVRELDLDNTETFIMTLGLLSAFDNTAGSVIATCLNHPSSTRPTLALAQRLWDEPSDIIRVANSGHVLFHKGVLQFTNTQKEMVDTEWERPFFVPGSVACRLLEISNVSNELLEPISTEKDASQWLEGFKIASNWMQSPAKHLRVVPILGARGCDIAEVAATVSNAAGRQAVRFTGDRYKLEDQSLLNALATCCWLDGHDLLLNTDTNMVTGLNNDLLCLPSEGIPCNVFVASEIRNTFNQVPSHILIPPVTVRNMHTDERKQFFINTLSDIGSLSEEDIAESARCFRLHKGTLKRVCQGLSDCNGNVDRTSLFEACRAEVMIDFGDLAEQITPRFDANELILPKKQKKQLEEIKLGMKYITHVHSEWNTSRVWNDAGLSALFAGSSGTGKTMAAEVLARELNLPIFRIDLSQVLDKYVGETSKRLKRIFDVAEMCDLILFFDEAEALFGRRTDVREARDRTANQETGYLLMRMESSKGMTILATNRKDDLDEAFTRRIRYIINFPRPDVAERRTIWTKAIPQGVNASDLDIHFLAKQFPLTGGQIRSAVFSACLQSAHTLRTSDDSQPRLYMRHVVVAVWRELEKVQRTIGHDQFGPYAELIRSLDK